MYSLVNSAESGESTIYDAYEKSVILSFQRVTPTHSFTDVDDVDGGKTTRTATHLGIEGSAADAVV